MCVKKIFFSLLLSFCVSACAFMPVTAYNQPLNKKCDDMISKKLTLGAMDVDSLQNCDSDDLNRCLIQTGVLSSVSFIVAGSIVLLGNTLHWSEYKIRC